MFGDIFLTLQPFRIALKAQFVEKRLHLKICDGRAGSEGSHLMLFSKGNGSQH